MKLVDVAMKIDNEKLLSLYPGYTSVLGPYVRKDNRKHIVLNNSNLPKGTKGKTKTISYPKALVESNNGVRLLQNETIDHKDRDFTNDTDDNLVIKDRAKHSSEDSLRVKVSDVKCPICSTVFTPSRDQRNNINMAGPFCSRTCSGSYGKYIQKGGNIITKTVIVKNYYKEVK